MTLAGSATRTATPSNTQRHTAATLLLEAGISVKVVSERLGHSTTSITTDLYQHVAPHMQEEAANRLGAMLLGEPEPKTES